MRPTIGLTSYWRQASLGPWTVNAAVASQGCIEEVRKAGGRALMLAPDAAWADDPADVIDLFDGLLLIGGDDISPSLWGRASAIRRSLRRARAATRSSQRCGIARWSTANRPTKRTTRPEPACSVPWPMRPATRGAPGSSTSRASLSSPDRRSPAGSHR